MNIVDKFFEEIKKEDDCLEEEGEFARTTVHAPSTALEEEDDEGETKVRIATELSSGKSKYDGRKDGDGEWRGNWAFYHLDPPLKGWNYTYGQYWGRTDTFRQSKTRTDVDGPTNIGGGDIDRGEHYVIFVAAYQNGRVEPTVYLTSQIPGNNIEYVLKNDLGYQEVVGKDGLNEEGDGGGDGASTGHGGGGSYGSPSSITYDGNDSQFWAGKVAGERNKKNRSGWQNMGGNKHQIYEEIVSDIIKKMRESTNEKWINKAYNEIQALKEADERPIDYAGEPEKFGLSAKDFSKKPVEFTKTGQKYTGPYKEPEGTEQTQEAMAAKLADSANWFWTNEENKKLAGEVSQVLSMAAIKIKGAENKKDLEDAGRLIIRVKKEINQSRALLNNIYPIFAWLQEVTSDGIKTGSTQPHQQTTSDRVEQPSDDKTVPGTTLKENEPTQDQIAKQNDSIASEGKIIVIYATVSGELILGAAKTTEAAMQLREVWKQDYGLQHEEIKAKKVSIAEVDPMGLLSPHDSEFKKESIYDNEEERLKHVMGKVADAEARRGEFSPDKEIDYEQKIRTMLALQKQNKDQEKWDQDIRSKFQTQITNTNK